MSNKAQNYTYYVCSILIVASAFAFIFEKQISPYIYAVAGAIVAVLLLTTTYKGDDFRLKRLNVQQFIAALLLPVSSYLMFNGVSEWFMFLLISYFLQVYVLYIRSKKSKNDHKPSE